MTGKAAALALQNRLAVGCAGQGSQHRSALDPQAVLGSLTPLGGVCAAHRPPQHGRRAPTPHPARWTWREPRFNGKCS